MLSLRRWKRRGRASLVLSVGCPHIEELAMYPIVPVESMAGAVQMICMCFSVFAAVLGMLWTRQ
jgi:hypothetical protein